MIYINIIEDLDGTCRLTSDDTEGEMAEMEGCRVVFNATEKDVSDELCTTVSEARDLIQEAHDCGR